MQVQERDVIWCLSRAHELTEHYRQYVLNSAHFPRSVDDLAWILETYLEKRIAIHELNLNAEGRDVKGLYLALDDGSYEIYLLAGMDSPNRRFVLCKELFHVLLDRDECRTTAIYAHLDEVASTFPVPHASANCPAVWELLAEAAAVEFLFPFGERLALRTSGRLGDAAEIAARYAIPQVFVESYCSDSAMEFFGSIEETIRGIAA